MPKREDTERAWIVARVTEYGSVQSSVPDGFTIRAWTLLCKHYGVQALPVKARNLEEALRAVAELANP